MPGYEASRDVAPRALAKRWHGAAWRRLGHRVGSVKFVRTNFCFSYPAPGSGDGRPGSSSGSPALRVAGDLLTLRRGGRTIGYLAVLALYIRERERPFSRRGRGGGLPGTAFSPDRGRGPGTARRITVWSGAFRPRPVRGPWSPGHCGRDTANCQGGPVGPRGDDGRRQALALVCRGPPCEIASYRCRGRPPLKRAARTPRGLAQAV
jgi:hypothetical protein